VEKIGLIAGNRRLPIFFAQAARKKECHIVAIGIKGDTSPMLKRFVDKLCWIDVTELNKLFEIFKAEGITKVVMAGQISPRWLFSKQVQNCEEIKDIFSRVKNKSADTLFGAVAQKLNECGIALLDSTTFIEDLLPQKGVLTTRQPRFTVWDDIYFGFDLAKEIAFLDIGQTVAVKDKAIVAVEALEGTDNLIRRAGALARGGFTVVKVSKPKQDMRFDIPVVGLNTIKNLARQKAVCLGIEAGKTIFVDREASILLAEKEGLSIVAI